MSENSKTFEECLSRLEQVVRILERGEASLDESLKLVQEGTSLVQRCGKLLDEAELVVKRVIPSADGQPAEEVFEDEV